MPKNSCFPHLTVANVSKILNETIENFLIYYTVTQSQLMTDLITAKTNNENLSEYKSIAQTYSDSHSDAINTKSELRDLFPEFDELLEMYTTNDVSIIQSPDPLAFNIISSESQIWDNAITHFTLYSSPKHCNELMQTVKLVSLLKKIQDSTLNTSQLVLDYWNRSNIILPKPPFPLPNKDVILPNQPIIEDPSILDSTLSLIEEDRKSVV